MSVSALRAVVLEFSSVLNPDPADLRLSITQLSEIVAYTHTAVCHITVLLLFYFHLH